MIVCLFNLPFAATVLAEDEPKLFGKDGIKVFESEDGSFEIRIDGRIQLDTAYYSGSETSLSNGTELRRGRLAVKAVLWEEWTSELDIDFADDEPEVKDAWIAFTGLESRLIKVGNHKEPFSLEELTSSRYIIFSERALPNVFAPGRHLGVSYTQWGKSWQGSAGFFGQEVSDGDEDGENEGFGASARFTFTPVRTGSRKVHLGISSALRTPDAGTRERARFRVRPETHVSRSRFLNTGRISDTDSYTVLGLETAAALGPVYLQGEYMSADVARNGDGRDASLSGWYALATWILTGENREYDGPAGEFGTIAPERKAGAVELALRYSSVDLNDPAAGVEGGSADNITLGMNYFFNRNVRLMLNLTAVDNDEFADGDGDFVGDDDFTIAQLRFQVAF